jgi:hypothetical protein
VQIVEIASSAVVDSATIVVPIARRRAAVAGGVGARCWCFAAMQRQAHAPIDRRSSATALFGAAAVPAREEIHTNMPN